MTERNGQIRSEIKSINGFILKGYDRIPTETETQWVEKKSIKLLKHMRQYFTIT